ncbi:hypothetical protein C4D60_Mb07t14390 [Musa balbisiana]|uniref:Uncharacterized protein n=1 Tax=Musa balbisiana TaxID=52838 RepID=A0A4S8JFH3_MUSBA|nr:hypothetical protein C4D60_Mb07t14390 [Musa balbisiana]
MAHVQSTILGLSSGGEERVGKGGREERKSGVFTRDAERVAQSWGLFDDNGTKKGLCAFAASSRNVNGGGWGDNEGPSASGLPTPKRLHLPLLHFDPAASGPRCAP